MMKLTGMCALALAFGAGAGVAGDLVFENARMRLTVGDDAIVNGVCPLQ